MAFGCGGDSDSGRYGAFAGRKQNFCLLRTKSFEEKPKTHLSNYAITGLYIYDNRVVEAARQVKPSGRGELEITELHNWYLKKGELAVDIVKGEWFDAGTFETLLRASSLMAEKAKKLLDEAGYPDPEGEVPRFKLVYKTSAKKDRVELALLIADYLRAVGIEVEVSSYEWGTFFRDIKNGNFQMFSLTWVGVTEPDIYYYAFHSSQIPPIGANRIFYYNPTLDLFLEQGRTTLDENKRREIYGQVQKIIYDDFVYVPLWYENNVVAVQENVVGYTLRPDAGFQNLVNTFVAE